MSEFAMSKMGAVASMLALLPIATIDVTSLPEIVMKGGLSAILLVGISAVWRNSKAAEERMWKYMRERDEAALATNKELVEALGELRLAVAELRENVLRHEERK